MKFFAYHGVLESEKQNGGDFAVDCEYEIISTNDKNKDSLESTVNYAEVYDMIADIVTNNRFNLVETLADTIADRLIESFPLNRIMIRVRKLNPPLPGDIDYFEVETERKR
jgi:dihydroneopterin aldolase